MVEDEDSASPSSSSVSLEQESGTRFVEIEGGENESLSEANLRIPYRANINVVAKSAVPSIFTSLPQLQDHVSTESSILQDKTVEECLPFLSGTAEQGLNDCNAHGLPRLRRELHLQYLYDALESYPASYVGYDASRPWVLYWSLTGLSLLGENVESYAERVTQTLSATQNLDGGFGGGHGQDSHVATSYAAILSLSMVGGAEALNVVDRKALWTWLGNVKQSDGGFAMAEGAEVDIRGAYCSMVIIALLQLPLDLPPNALARALGMTSFLDKLPEWLGRCQTYEGGISSSPGTEAHGAYSFCAIACLCILGEPKEILPKYLNLPLLISWLSARQYAPEGGFSGRTNKLVDGCYSHWVGGCWPFIETALGELTRAGSRTSTLPVDLFSREGLARYILCCCQARDGGLRDKPSKHPDAYHSCYTLAGLSLTQHRSCFETTTDSSQIPVESAFRWRHVDWKTGGGWTEGLHMFEEDDIVRPVHPIFVIPFDVVERTRTWFGKKGEVGSAYSKGRTGDSMPPSLYH